MGRSAADDMTGEVNGGEKKEKIQAKTQCLGGTTNFRRTFWDHLLDLT